MSDDEIQAPRVLRVKKPINRKTKKHLVWDPEARKEFLTGFHKRKLQRKKKAQEKFQEQLKLERKRLKKEARENFKKLVGVHRPIPSLEDFASQNFDLENHSVSIVELSTSDLAEKNNWIGPNKVVYEEEEKNVSEDEKTEEVPGMSLKPLPDKTALPSEKSTPHFKTCKDVKKALKKKATKEVQNSRAFQLKNKIERQKSRKKSLQQKKRQEILRLKKGKFKHKQKS